MRALPGAVLLNGTGGGVVEIPALNATAAPSNATAAPANATAVDGSTAQLQVEGGSIGEAGAGARPVGDGGVPAAGGAAQAASSAACGPNSTVVVVYDLQARRAAFAGHGTLRPTPLDFMSTGH